MNRLATFVRQAPLPALPTKKNLVTLTTVTTFIYLILSPLGNSLLDLVQGYQSDAHSLSLSGDSAKTQCVSFDSRHLSWIFSPCVLLISRDREPGWGAAAWSWPMESSRAKRSGGIGNQRERPSSLTSLF